MSGNEPLTPSDDRAALAGELIGARLSITSAPGLGPRPRAGTIVDETMHTFLLEFDGQARARRVPKQGLVGTVEIGGRRIPLNGELLRVRPQDRTKRLLLGRPRKAP